MALRVNSLVFVEIFVNSSRLTAQDINTTLLHTRELHVPGGGVLWGKKDRDDHRKSYKTTPQKILSHNNLRTLKHTSWSKINLKIPINRSLLKKSIQKICTHDNSKFLYPNKYSCF